MNLPAPTQVRRAANLWLDVCESTHLDAAKLLSGQSALHTVGQWQAWLPALQRQVPLQPADLELLLQISEVYWTQVAQLQPALQLRIPPLLDSGVLVAMQQPEQPLPPPLQDSAEADLQLREGHWHPLSALLHAFGRWEGQHHGEDGHLNRFTSLAQMIEQVGPPPPAVPELEHAAPLIVLPAARPGGLQGLASQRRTVRNFDRSQALPLAVLADVLAASLAVHGEEEAAPGAIVFKKNVPSGGALHPVEAYLLVQHVDGLAPGLYHYDARARALAPLPASHSELPELASRFVAGQLWFADAHVQIVLVARFRRNFWKYRRHSKAYRALVLDAGHLSQMIYLAATECGAGAFITAAINELDIEAALGLQPMLDSPLAVCGLGVPAQQRRTREFQPPPLGVHSD